jgi:hypothetical protein
MGLFKTIYNCSNINKIADINAQFDYEDEYPQGEGDSKEVACGQGKTYNELQYIYDNILSKFVTSEKITHQKAIDALCNACHELKNPRNRVDFYKYLSAKLKISI